MRYWLALLFLAVSAAMLTPIPLSAQDAASVPEDTVYAEVVTKTVYVVTDSNGTVSGMFPLAPYMEHGYIYVYSENSSSDIRFKIMDKSWSWIREPTGHLYVPQNDTDVTLWYSLDVSVYTKSYRNETEGKTYAAVVIEVKLYTYFKITRTTHAGVFPLGAYLMQYAYPYNSYPELKVYVKAMRIRDGIPSGIVEIERKIGFSYYTEEDFNLVNIRFKIESFGLTLSPSSYAVEGDLSTGAVVYPIYDILVCAKSLGGLPSETVTASVTIEDKTREMTIGGGEDCKLFSGVRIVPGKDTLVYAYIALGDATITANLTTDAEGMLLHISRPYGKAVGRNGVEWHVAIVSVASATGYYADPGSKMELQGEVESQLGTIACTPITINRSGSYRIVCEGNLTTNHPMPPKDFLEYRFTMKLIVHDDVGGIHRLSGTVDMTAVDPAEISTMAWNVYDTVLRVLFMGVIVLVSLMLISLFKESFTGSPLIPHDYLKSSLFGVVVSIAVLYLVIPAVYKVYLSVLSQIPLFQRYVDQPPSMEPRVVFEHLVGYYDRLFGDIELDYQTMFIGGIQGVLNTLMIDIGIFLVFMAIALGLSTILTPGASVPFSSIAGVVISFVFSFISLLVMIGPAGAMILVAVSLGRVVVLFITVVVLFLMLVGTFLIVLPSPLTQRIGEDLFGAGLLYFIAFPTLAPIIYSMYHYIIDSALASIRGMLLNVPLGIANIFIPIQPLLTIMTFIVASGVALLLVLLSLSYILTRSGVAAGLGEAFSGLVWR